MSRTEITMRILSAEATLPLQDLPRGSGPGAVDRSRVLAKIGDAPLFIDDSPNMSLMEIRAKARRSSSSTTRRRHRLSAAMSSGKKVESRQQEVAGFAGVEARPRARGAGHRDLAANRGPEQRTDKRPQMSDLRESGSIGQVPTSSSVAPQRSDQSDGEADVIVAKHRNGPTKDIVLAFKALQPLQQHGPRRPCCRDCRDALNLVRLAVESKNPRKPLRG